MEKLESIGESGTREGARRYVKVGRPARHAGTGEALRKAYDLNGAARDLAAFEDLLARLD